MKIIKCELVGQFTYITVQFDVARTRTLWEYLTGSTITPHKRVYARRGSHSPFFLVKDDVLTILEDTSLWLKLDNLYQSWKATKAHQMMEESK